MVRRPPAGLASNAADLVHGIQTFADGAEGGLSQTRRQSGSAVSRFNIAAASAMASPWQVPAIL